MSSLSGKRETRAAGEEVRDTSTSLPAPVGAVREATPPRRGLGVLGGWGRKRKRVEGEIDALRLRVMASEPRRANRNDAVVVALAARTRGEGVSTVALALARSFVRNGDGRVLLVDADPESNDLARKASRGLASGARVSVIETAEDIAALGEVEPVADWEVDLLALRAEGRILEGPQWDDRLSAMRARYDVIVVDTGSLQEGALRLWSSVASQVLLVVDTTRTTVQALERLAKDLESSKQSLTGIVLNKRDYPIPQFLY